MNDKLIVFDCFGVLVNEVAPQWLYAHFEKNEADRIKNEIVARGDKNDISGKEMFDTIGKLSGLPGKQVLNEWIEISKQKTDVIDFVIKLRKKYKTALLSNAPEGLVQSVLSEQQLADMFDYRVISNEVKMVKPDSDIYEHLLKITGRKGEDCIFTDDNECNLIPAQKLGIKTILFKNLEQYTDELEKLGITF